MTIIDRIRDFVADLNGPLCAEDRPLWESARTIPDLCDLTARWLRGEIQSQPGYYGPVDVDEDDAPGLTDALVALNRAGFLTQNSQCGFDGVGYDGAHWTQIASVSGFCSDDLTGWLQKLNWMVGVDVTAWRIGHRGPFIADSVTVTRRDGVAYTGFGGPLSCRDVADMYDGCSDEAVDVLAAGWHVVIASTKGPGDNTLWARLREAAEARVSISKTTTTEVDASPHD